VYIYRAVDGLGQTAGFLLSDKRDAEAAKRTFRKALGQPHRVNPRNITVDKNPTCPCAVEQMKEDGELWRRSRLGQVKLLNSIVGQDHRRVKRPADGGLARRFPHCSTNTGRLGGDGNGEDGATLED
jgi:transposase-like protein